MAPQSKGGDALAPLLPELQLPNELAAEFSGASFSSAVFNLSTSTIGAGIMSIPATLRVLGVAPAFLLIATVALLCDASVEFLTRYTATTGASAAAASYSGVMAESFGWAGAAALQICVALTNLGSLIMYLIIIGDVLSGNGSERGEVAHLGVLQEWFGNDWWTARSPAIFITVVVVMLPLVLLRRVACAPANSPFPPQNPQLKSHAMAPQTKGGDALAPLLPELQLPNESAAEFAGASFSSAVFNLSTSIVGAGIMSIPATLRVLGVAPAFLLIATVALLCDASVEFLTRYTATAGASAAAASYSGVMAESFGWAGAAALQICVAVTNLGGLIMYLIIIGDVLSGNGSERGEAAHLGVLQEWFGNDWWTARSPAIFITVVVVMLPLVLLRRVDSLRFTSAMSILLAVVFVVISSAMAVYALLHGTIQTPRLLPDFTNQSFLDLFTTVPVIVVAFTFHFNVHPIQAELSRVSDMIPAVRASLLLCSAIYAAVGLAGYLLFGDGTMADVLSNFDRSSTSPLLDDVVRLSYALHLVLVFPLLFYSLRLNIDGLIFPKVRRPLVEDAGRFLWLTALLLAFVYLAAIAIPNIWTVFQFMGSTSAVSLSLIFPGAIVLRDIHGISKRKDKILAGIMISLAVITSCVAIYSNISSIISSKVKSNLL